MATILDESFLADIDELCDIHIEEEDLKTHNFNFDFDFDSVAKLENSGRFMDILHKVEDALEKKKNKSDDLAAEYELVTECNSLSLDIDNQIVLIHNFVRDNYRLKFPELESLVNHPIDYCRVVKRIGNEIDLTLVDLGGLLASAIIMAVSIAASTTSGKPLADDILQNTMEACDRALDLDSSKKKMLGFVESRMGYIAPNLTAIVGSAFAAKLIDAAGGLSALARMPACNLGAKKKNLAGFSSSQYLGVGYLDETEIFQSTPPSLRMRASRLLAAKSTLAARMDYSSKTGETARTTFGADVLHNKIEKWQELPPAKRPKPLPVPADSEPKKKKRGGRRLRKMKQRYGVTDMRKLCSLGFQTRVHPSSNHELHVFES